MGFSDPFHPVDTKPNKHKRTESPHHPNVARRRLLRSAQRSLLNARHTLRKRHAFIAQCPALIAQRPQSRHSLSSRPAQPPNPSPDRRFQHSPKAQNSTQSTPRTPHTQSKRVAGCPTLALSGSTTNRGAPSLTQFHRG
jgi:hypothetical protein